MACYNCGSDYCNGNCNNNAGFLIVLFVVCFPYIPFAVVFYEISSSLSGGVNIIKWIGAAAGGFLGYKVWFDWFPIWTKRYLSNFFLYWFVVYLISCFLFLILGNFFPSNVVVMKIVNLIKSLSYWALSVS